MERWPGGRGGVTEADQKIGKSLFPCTVGEILLLLRGSSALKYRIA